MKIDKTKLLLTLVVLLTALNVTTLASIWRFVDFKTFSFTANNSHSNRPNEFIITKLKLNKEQQVFFEALREEHFEQIMVLKKNIREEKNAMYDLLKSNETDSVTTFNHIAKIMQNEEQLERITFTHFKKLRAICTPEQQQHFDVIIDEVTRMIMREPGHSGVRPQLPNNQPLP